MLILYSGIGRLLGIEGVSGIQWRLGNGLPPTLLAAILIGALLFAFWSYRRENVSQRKNLLVVLRSVGNLHPLNCSFTTIGLPATRGRG